MLISLFQLVKVRLLCPLLRVLKRMIVSLFSAGLLLRIATLWKIYTGYRGADMPAGNLDIEITKGDDWELVFDWKNEDETAIDNTGYSAEMFIREEIDSTGTPLITFNSSGIPTPDGTIVLGGVSGRFTISLPNSFTESISFETGGYDLELTDPLSKKFKLLTGSVKIIGEFTRADI